MKLLISFTIFQNEDITEEKEDIFIDENYICEIENGIIKASVQSISYEKFLDNEIQKSLIEKIGF